MERQRRSVSGWLRRHRAALLSGSWRLLLLALLTVVVLQVVAPATYRIEQGYVTFRLNPVRPVSAGHVIMPLGPGGVLRLEHASHAGRSRSRLPPRRPPADGRRGRDLLRGDAVERDAVSAFDRFAWSRVPWILAAGVLVGLLVAGSGRRRSRDAGGTRLEGAHQRVARIEGGRRRAASCGGLRHGSPPRDWAPLRPASALPCSWAYGRDPRPVTGDRLSGACRKRSARARPGGALRT